MANKFVATWISYSSAGDFLKCPKSYYYRNVYKSPTTNRKISIVSPYLSLGVAVHDVLEPLAWLPKAQRLDVDYNKKFFNSFNNFSGKKGGFNSKDQEREFADRGLSMLKNVWQNPGPIINPALRLLEDKSELPWMWLSENDEIILTGKVDWLEWTEAGIRVIDFKTNLKADEKEGSLQLPMYQILLKHFKKTPMVGAAYWYLARENGIVDQKLPNFKDSLDKVTKVAYSVKEARAKKAYNCPYGGCRNCEPYERLMRGEGEFVGVGGFKQELYYLK